MSDVTKRPKTGGRKKKNLMGLVFGKWTVTGEADSARTPSGGVLTRWLCRCECGTERPVLSSGLTTGISRSCGCAPRNQTKPGVDPAPSVLRDMTGQQVGSWTVIERASSKAWGNGRKSTRWLCRCVCGDVREVYARSLVNGRSTSCGCVSWGARGGLSYTLEYRCWVGMRSRCNTKTGRSYKNYGGRGITVCTRWNDKEHGFTNFFNDMGAAPTPDHSVDRKDNNRGYWCGKSECPECGPLSRKPNCRWATMQEQNNNRRGVRSIENYTADELVTALINRGYTVVPSPDPAPDSTSDPTPG